MRAIIKAGQVGRCCVFLTLLVVFAVENGFCADAGQEIAFQGKLYCSLKRSVPLPFLGIINEVRAHAGMKVKKGDVLLVYKLDPEVIKSLRQRLSQAPLLEVQANISAAQSALSSKRVEYNDVKTLSAKKMAPETQIKQLEGEISAQSGKLQYLQKQFETGKQTAQDDLAILRTQLGKDVSAANLPETVAIEALIDGIVTWINPDLRPGALLGGGAAVAVIGVMDTMLIRANLFEVEASQIRVGDKAKVTLPSIPNKAFEGTLSRISWTPVAPGLDQPSYYEVELSVPNPELLLKEGYKATVTFNPVK